MRKIAFQYTTETTIEQLIEWYRQAACRPHYIFDPETYQLYDLREEPNG